MNELAPVLGVVSLAAIAAWVIRTLVHAYRQHKTARMQVELQTRLLERFDSQEGLMGYLESEAGHRFVESVRLEEPKNPYGRILGAIQVGLVLVAAGIACLFLDGRMPFDDERGLLFLGTVGTALGIGFLISAALSWWLSKTWGLIDDRGA